MKKLQICALLQEWLSQNLSLFLLLFQVEGVSYCQCPEKKSSVYDVVDERCGESDTCWAPFLERKDVIVWRREHHQHRGLYAYKVPNWHLVLMLTIFGLFGSTSFQRHKWPQTKMHTNSDTIFEHSFLCSITW